MTTRLPVKIFISSPGDVEQERVITARIIKRLAERYAHIAEISGVFWEHEPLTATDTFQRQIIPPSKTDIAICILWSRLGTRLPKDITRQDGSRYNSGTEFEFEDAFLSQKEHGLPDLLVYRKTSEPLVSLTDEDALLQRIEQKRALDRFIDKWFVAEDGSLIAAFHPFKSGAQFEELLEIHLIKLIDTRLHKAGLTGAALARVVEKHQQTWHGSPFRGLETFEFEHADIFFGRTRATEDIINQLRKQHEKGHPFVIVMGMSGSGKSSVVHAGVLPLMIQPGVIEGVSEWRRAVMKPSDNGGKLLETLAQALTDTAGLPELIDDDTSLVSFSAQCATQPQAAAAVVLSELKQLGKLNMAAQAERLKAGSDTTEPASPSAYKVNLVLVIDQLEEMFTHTSIDDAQREAFVAALDALCRTGRVWVIATLRSDFYVQASELRSLEALRKGDGQIDLFPPTSNEISQMIRLPAYAAGLSFEENTATGARLDDMLRDAAATQEGSLPLLQFTLSELYKLRGEDGTLTQQAYTDLGGLEGALASTAEEAFNALPEASKSAFGFVFRQLVHLSAAGESYTKARPAMAPLLAKSGVKAFVDAFVARRLFIVDQDELQQPVVSIAHEALIKAWPRLVQWLAHDQELLRMRSRLSYACSRWHEAGADEQLLLNSGKPLEEAEILTAEEGIFLSDSEREFVSQSRRKMQARRRTKRLAVVALGCMAVLASAAAVFASLQREKALQNENTAVAAQQLAERNDLTSKQRLAQVFTQQGQQALEQDEPHRAALLLAAAWQYAKGATNEYLLAKAVAQTQVEQLLTHPDRNGSVALVFSPDASLVALSDQAGYLELWSVNDSQLIKRWRAHQDAITQIVFSRSGKTLFTASSDNQIKAFDVASLTEKWTSSDHFGAVFELQLVADGTKLLSTAYDNSSLLLDAQSGALLSKISFSDNTDIRHSLYVDDKQQVLTFSSNGVVSRWLTTSSIATKVMYCVLPDISNIVAVNAIPGNSVFVFTDVAGQSIAASAGCTRQTLPVAGADPSILSVSSGLALGSQGKVWSLTDDAAATSFQPTLSPAMHLLYQPALSRALLSDKAGNVELWQVQDNPTTNSSPPGTLLQKSAGLGAALQASALSDDGRYAAALDEQGRLRLINITNTTQALLPVADTQTPLRSVFTFAKHNRAFLISELNRVIEVDLAEHTVREEYTLDNSVEPISQLVMSPDGSYIAALAGNITVFRLGSASPTAIIPPSTTDNAFSSIVFSDDNRLLVSEGDGSTSESTGLWRAMSTQGEELLRATLSRADSVAQIVSFNKGYYALTLGNNMLKLWYAQTGQFRHTVAYGVSMFAPSSDDNKIAVGYNDGTLRVVRHTQNVLAELTQAGKPAHQGRVEQLLWSNDLRYLVSVAQREVKLWDIQTQSLKAQLKGNRSKVVAMAFSADDRYLLSLGLAGDLVLSDTQTGAVLYQQRHEKLLPRVVFNALQNQFEMASLDGEILALKVPAMTQDDESLIVSVKANNPWGYEDGKTPPPDEWTQLAIAVLDETLAARYPERYQAKTAAYLRSTDMVRQAILTDNLTLADIALQQLRQNGVEGAEIDALRAQVEPHFTGMLRRFSQHSERIEAAVFTPDNRQLITSSWDNTIHVSDIKTGEYRTIASGDSYSFISLHPDGEQFMASSLNRGTTVWRLSDLAEAVRLPELNERAFWTSDGKHIVGFRRGEAPLLYSVDGRLLQRTGDWLNDYQQTDLVAVSQNGQRIVQANKAWIKLYDIASKTLIKQWDVTLFSSQEAPRVRDIVLSKDGSRMLLALQNDNVVAVTVQSATDISQISLPIFSANTVSFNSDETYVLADTAKNAESYHFATKQHRVLAQGALESAEHQVASKHLAAVLNSDQGVLLVDLASGAIVASTLDRGVGYRRVLLSPDERRLAINDGAGIARVFDVDAMKLIHSNHVVAGDWQQAAINTQDGALLLVAEDKTVVVTLDAPFTPYEVVVDSDDQPALAQMAYNGGLLIATEYGLGVEKRGEYKPVDIAFAVEQYDDELLMQSAAASGNGRYLATLWIDGQLSIISAADALMPLNHVLAPDCDEATDLRWYDTALLALQCDSNVVFYSADTKQEITRVADLALPLLKDARYNAALHRLVLAHLDPEQARVIDTQSGNTVAQLSGHITGVSAVAFSRDGSKFATADLDGRILLWDSVSLKRLGSWQDGAEPVTKLIFVADNWLLSLRQSSEVSLWQWQSHSLINQFKPSAGGKLLAAAVDEKQLITVDNTGTIKRYALY